MVSVNNLNKDEDPLAFFIGLKNGLLIACPFWLIVCGIAALILYNCR